MGQAMTIASGVAQFGRFGVVLLALLRFGLPMGFSRCVSALGFSVLLLLLAALQELFLAQVFYEGP